MIAYSAAYLNAAKMNLTLQNILNRTDLLSIKTTNLSFWSDIDESSITLALCDKGSVIFKE